MQEGSHGCPSLSYCTAQALSGCHQSCGVGTELSPSWGALGQQQSCSALQALLYTSCGSTESEPEPRVALLPTGDLLLGGLF